APAIAPIAPPRGGASMARTDSTTAQSAQPPRSSRGAGAAVTTGGIGIGTGAAFSTGARSDGAPASGALGAPGVAPARSQGTGPRARSNGSSSVDEARSPRR